MPGTRIMEVKTVILALVAAVIEALAWMCRLAMPGLNTLGHQEPSWIHRSDQADRLQTVSMAKICQT